MEETKELNGDGGVYLRALIIQHRGLEPVKTGTRFLGDIAKAKASIKDCDGAICYVTVESHTAPPAYLRDKIKPSQEKYSYKIYVGDVSVGDTPALLVASPLKELFDEIRPRASLFYSKCDLSKVCTDQYRGSADPNIRITRLNARLYGEIADKANSVALYGKDVMASCALRNLLGPKPIDDSGQELRVLQFGAPTTPSGSEEENLWLDPNSCRLKLDDGSGETFNLNVDRFGNYSFFLREMTNVHGVFLILRYIVQIGALSNTPIDPLKRSDTAIEEVSH